MTGGGSYDAGIQHGKERLLCLHRNENLFVGADWIVERARAVAADIDVRSYPDPTASTLRRTLAAHHGVPVDRIFTGNGSDEVLALLFATMRERYDAVSTLDVCFKVYPMLAARYGYTARTLPGDTFATGRIDAPTDFRGFAVVDSPNSITGVHVAPDAVLALAADPTAFVVWDNVYGEYAGDRIPADLPSNVAVVRSFSKFYALAALRVGYCIADPSVVATLDARRDVFNVNGFAQAMAVDALARHEQFERHRAEMIACRTDLVERLEARGFRVQPPAGHFVYATHDGIDGLELQRRLMDRGVAVRHFFDPPIAAQWVRITVPPPAGVDQLTEALDDVLAATRG